MQQEAIDDWFAYRLPTPAIHISLTEELRASAYAFANAIHLHVPDGPDKAAAIRMLRASCFIAHEAIVARGRK